MRKRLRKIPHESAGTRVVLLSQEPHVVAQGQQLALESLYQELSRTRDERVLAEVEQSLAIAAQQLQLAGNVPVAVLALQTAYGRPLDKAESQKPAAATSWWQGAAGDVWQELKGLVRIQRFDREDPALLAPGQGYFLRENLKLRLLNARLALFSRDQWTYRNELKVAQEWLGKHFDTNDKAVVGAQSTLRQMTASEINVELPNLNETQAALRNLRQTKEKR